MRCVDCFFNYFYNLKSLIFFVITACVINMIFSSFQVTLIFTYTALSHFEVVEHWREMSTFQDISRNESYFISLVLLIA